MATRATLLTALRTRLEDTSGTPLWSDTDLREALTEAMRQYGVRLPVQSSATINVVANTTSYALPAGVTSDGLVYVLDGDGDVIERDHLVGGAPGPSNSTGYVQAWRVWGQTFYLSRIPTIAEVYTLQYRAGRELVADDVTTQPIDAGDEPIVLALAAAWAYQRRGNEDMKRGNAVDRWLRREGEAIEEADRLIRARMRRVRGSVMS